MKHPIYYFLLTAVCILPSLFSGCGGTPVPDELKGLAPVTITITNGGSPLADTGVLLSAESGGGAWAARGTTDAKGVAVIETSRASYTGKGAPAGKYKVILQKSVTYPPELEPQESDQDLAPSVAAAKEAKRQEFLKKNRIIPAEFETAAKSPAELTVAEKTGATLTVDISQGKK